jgi:hypothetical protein
VTGAEMQRLEEATETQVRWAEEEEEGEGWGKVVVRRVSAIDPHQ